MKRSPELEVLIECCGETLSAAALTLAAEPPDPATLTTALNALANAAEGASLLVGAASTVLGPDQTVDVEIAGLDGLFRAKSAIEQICTQVEFFPSEEARS